MLQPLIALLVFHWFGDFILQTRWMANNKSKRLDALALHVAVYTAVMFLGFIMIGGGSAAVPFAIVTGGLHFATDFVTSKCTAALYRAKREHDFFAVIGFDQFLHQAALAVTMWFFLVP